MTRSQIASQWLPLCIIGFGLVITLEAAESPAPIAPPVDASWLAKVETIENGLVRVGADALHGGRLVEYSLGGRNALYSDALHPEWVFPDNDHWVGPAGGRFDIGPEEILLEHTVLTDGPWTIERVDRLHLRMVSPVDTVTGVQLNRDVVLDPGSTRLRCTTTTTNRSDRLLHRSYWGRSLAPGGGIFITSLTPDSRFLNQFIEYTLYPTFQILMQPKDPAVTIRGEYLMLRGAPLQPKIGLDTQSGWMAYLMRTGMLFVKRFPVYPERRYADLAGLTISVWSNQDRMVELEPLGPEERLAPGQSATFTEDWWLLDHPFPADGEEVDPARIRAFADQQAPPAP